MTATIRILALSAAVAAIAALIGPAPAAAPAPGSFRAGIITDTARLGSPGKLTIDGRPEISVIDASQNRVQQFDLTGMPNGSVKRERPSAVAASGDRTLYIGSHRDYGVAICREGICEGYLGNGSNEFLSILDIAVDAATGDVYVADATDNCVKVYSSSGVPQAVIRGLHAPAAVTVNDDEVYILDFPAGPPASGSTYPRISVYSRSGGFLRGIGEPDGSMRRPVDIAVDRFGNIFVADAGRRSILVFDARGTAVGEITGENRRFSVPVSVAVSRDGRVLVSCSETHSIAEIGLSGSSFFPTPLSFDFRSLTGVRLSPSVLGY